MSSEWIGRRLDDVAAVVSGQSPSGTALNEEGEGLPFFQGARDFSARHPQPRVFTTDPRRRAERGDILLSVRAPVGRVNTADRRCAVGRGVAAIRAADAADTTFLFYILAAREGSWSAIESSGSVFSNLGRKELLALSVPWPSRRERHGIAGVLRAIDEKIDSNRRTFRRLQSLQCEHFERWRQVEHADSATGSLVDIAGFVNGRNFTKGASGSGRPVLRIKELNGGIRDATVFSDVAAPEEHLALHFDLLFAWSGSLGACRWEGPEGLVNQHIFKVVPSRYPLWFVEGWLAVHMPAFQAIARDKATTMGHIQRRHLAEAKVLLPPADALAAMDREIGPLDARRSSLSRETIRLTEARDMLLPKLISGRIRVPDSYDPGDVLGTVAADAGLDADVGAAA